jgi:predicted Ser/Thr protein kinase
MIEPLPGDIFRKGQVLNNTYEVEGVLGRGGTGEVYRARNQITGRTVAVKALNRAMSANDAYLELMKREEEMRAISNDAVVRYTDCSRTAEGHVYLVMDYVDGTPLSDWLERGGASPRDLMVVAHRVAEGLVATHAKKIVHRDLSPDNIILRGNDPAGATIIDFGIAKDASAGARTIVGNDFAGKYEYAAPEQMHGRAEPASDLYALGASLLATYRGRVPDPGSTPGAVLARKEKPLDTEGVPEPLKSLIDTLTEPDPARRPPSAAVVVGMIDGLLKRPASTEAGKRRAGPIAAALLAAVAAAAAIVWWSGLLDPPLPPAAPYTLSASLDADGNARLAGHAPDAASRDALVAGFAEAAGTTVPEDSLALAAGEPTPEWSDVALSLIAAAAPLTAWSIEIEDRAAALSGLAPDRAAGEAARQAFEAAAQEAGFEPAVEIDAPLAASTVAAAIEPHASCGPLEVTGADGGAFLPGGTVGVVGNVADEAGASAVRQALEEVIGDRTGDASGLTVLWPELCAILGMLPGEQDSSIDVALGYGDRSDVNLTGTYAVGETVVVDLLVPADVRGNVWVILAQSDGTYHNLMPTEESAKSDLAALGEENNGLRRIRVLRAKVDERSGKTALVALLSEAQLFAAAASISEALPLETFAADLRRAIENGMVIRSSQTRVIDSR